MLDVLLEESHEWKSEMSFFLAFKALKDRKLRTGLTVLGIVIGAAMVVALVASTSGLTASVTAQISKMGVTLLTVSPSSAGFR